MENFQWGGMDAEGEIYMDENNRRIATNIRLQMTNLADAFARYGEPSRGLDVLNRILEATPSRNVPYTRVMLPVVELLSDLAQDDGLSAEAKAKAADLAKTVGQELFDQLADDLTYFISLDDQYYVASESSIQTVSYTHLTLPTILLV